MHKPLLSGCSYMYIMIITYLFLISGSCLGSSGDVAGGGAIELVAEKGEIIIGNKLEIFSSIYMEIIIYNLGQNC